MKATVLWTMGLLLAAMGASMAMTPQSQPTAQEPPRGTLMLQTPPLQVNGDWLVPVREFCRWLRAEIAIPADRARLAVTWRGKSHTWTPESGGLAFRDGTGFVSIREFGDAFGQEVRLREGGKIVDFGTPGDPVCTPIPVGWERPTPPRSLSTTERDVWQCLMKSQLGVRGIIAEPSNIHIAGRWAVADVRALNALADDAQVILEKRWGTWRVIATGTDLSGRNYGIPAATRKTLGLPF